MNAWIAHWHPIVVHLPIGFGVLACLFLLAGQWSRYNFVNPVISLISWLSVIASLMAVVSGLLLADQGDYDSEQVFRHQWAGLITTVLLLLMALYAPRLKEGKASPPWVKSLGAVGVLGALTLTGHWGGVLTHGEDYWQVIQMEEMTAPMPNGQAQVFQHTIYPLFKSNCLKCHNQNKRKGGLALHSLAAVLQGGKNGKVVNTDVPAQSELWRRVMLPVDHEEFMPKGKKQSLSPDALALLNWWLSLRPGHDDLPLELTPIPDSINSILSAKGINVTGKTNQLATEGPLNIQTPPLDEQILSELREAGYRIKKIHSQPDLLDVVLPAPLTTPADQLSATLKLLEAIKDHIYWLNLSGLQLTDDQIDNLPVCSNLRLLNLSANNLTDNAHKSALKQKNLEVLILHHTRVTARLLSQLQSLPQLKKVYVWQTGISPSDVSLGQYAFHSIFSE